MKNYKNMDEKIKTSKGEVYLPSLPNFISQDTSEDCEFQYKHIDVASFTDDDLRAIGKAYTDELIKHAEFRRNEPN